MQLFRHRDKWEIEEKKNYWATNQFHLYIRRTRVNRTHNIRRSLKITPVQPCYDLMSILWCACIETIANESKINDDDQLYILRQFLFVFGTQVAVVRINVWTVTDDDGVGTKIICWAMSNPKSIEIRSVAKTVCKKWSTRRQFDLFIDCNAHYSRDVHCCD